MEAHERNRFKPVQYSLRFQKETKAEVEGENIDLPAKQQLPVERKKERKRRKKNILILQYLFYTFSLLIFYSVVLESVKRRRISRRKEKQKRLDIDLYAVYFVGVEKERRREGNCTRRVRIVRGQRRRTLIGRGRGCVVQHRTLPQFQSIVDRFDGLISLSFSLHVRSVFRRIKRYTYICMGHVGTGSSLTLCSGPPCHDPSLFRSGFVHLTLYNLSSCSSYPVEHPLLRETERSTPSKLWLKNVKSIKLRISQRRRQSSDTSLK